MCTSTLYKPIWEANRDMILGQFWGSYAHISEGWKGIGSFELVWVAGSAVAYDLLTASTNK